ncbi:MAG: DUF4249 family protein [Bacteroidetes bacterium]|nr:DUF4249 family protein [Bacteroidota bacterium]
MKTRVLFQLYTLPAVFMLLLLSACGNEVPINAKWKETIIVYGTLDPQAKTQYIRIEKAFLDENSGALQVAKIADSLYLDSAKVTLLQLGSSPRTIPMVRTQVLPKDSGIFANDKNPLWTTTEPIIANTEYRIEIQNLRTGNVITANTKTVGSMQIFSPFRDSTSKFSCLTDFIAFSFTPGENARAYDVQMHVVYDEWKQADTTKKTRKTAVWYLMTNFSTEPGVRALNQVPRKAFQQFLTSTIHTDSVTFHRLRWVGLTMYGGNQTLLDYISVNEPSIGIVQKQSEYTNINGGYGIFASRCMQRIDRVPIDPASIYYLRTNSLSKSLNLVP